MGLFLGEMFFWGGVFDQRARRHLAELATFGGLFLITWLTLSRFGWLFWWLACADLDLGSPWPKLGGFSSRRPFGFPARGVFSLPLPDLPRRGVFHRATPSSDFFSLG